MHNQVQPYWPNQLLCMAAVLKGHWCHFSYFFLTHVQKKEKRNFVFNLHSKLIVPSVPWLICMNFNRCPFGYLTHYCCFTLNSKLEFDYIFLKKRRWEYNGKSSWLVAANEIENRPIYRLSSRYWQPAPNTHRILDGKYWNIWYREGAAYFLRQPRFSTILYDLLDLLINMNSYVIMI